ncbi:MAG: hypothetical protein AAF512_03845 [Pseudomonadota bacterium]
MRKLMSLIFLLLVLCTPIQGTHAKDSRVSEGSVVLSAELSMLMISGGTEAAQLSGEFVIISVKESSDVLSVVLRHVVDGSEVVLQAAAKTMSASAFVAGSSLQISAEATGTLFTQAGKVIAFVPNQLGQSLTHHSDYATARIPDDEEDL